MNRDISLAREIANLHGLNAGRIVSIERHGSVNRVYVVDGHVVRFAMDRLRSDEFAVEQWCSTQAVARGIPSPGVVARGNVEGVPYLIQTFVAGITGAHHPMASWTWLAQYAGIIHTIDVTGAPDELFSRFGRNLPGAWQQHLAYNAGQLSRSDPLIRFGVYSPGQQPDLRAAVLRLATPPLPLGLLHGDLSPRNLLVPADGPPVLIDWGTAAIGPVPHGELLPLLHAH